MKDINSAIDMGSNSAFQYGPGNQHSQFDLASHDYIPIYIHFNSKKYVHSVENVSHISLMEVLKTRVTGGPDFQSQIVNILQSELGACLPSHFNDAEWTQITVGDPSTWGVILLYKLIQNVLGFVPMGSSLLAEEDDEATLESLVYKIKEKHVEVRHHFDERILSDTELGTKLEELRALSVKIFEGVIGFAADRRWVLDIEEIENAKMTIDAVIDEVKPMVMDQ